MPPHTQNVFDKIEQYYALSCNYPEEFSGLKVIGILTKMLQTGLFVPGTSFAMVGVTVG